MNHPMQVTARVDLKTTRNAPASRSPTPASVHPRADPSLRKLSSASSLVTSRPGSPLRPSRQNGVSPPPKARVTARRAAPPTTTPVKLKLPAERPLSASPTSPSQPPPSALAGPPPAIRIKSKVTNFAKSASSNAGDSLSRSLSPPYATTRPVLPRSRAPSITTLSLNDPPPLSTFYPITTASPAANPHRYAPRRPPSPTRSYPSPTLSSEPGSAKRSPLVPRVDPALVPLPPHSPPISAVSISSKSSTSKTPVSLNGDQITENHIPGALSHIHRRSVERIPFLPQAEFKARDRSRSKERSPRDTLHRTESDTDSEGSERQLKAEAKTNRKIADLEITNRSLLAINASLETTKNRQAKEIRDLRRKLRESKLILPPQAFKAVTSAMDDEDEDDEESDVEADEDMTYQRVKNLVDGLIESGKKALEMRPEDFRATLATKVLNADELRSWRDYGQSARTSLTDKQNVDDETIRSHASPLTVVTPDSSSSFSVESDEELASRAPGSPALPPITITHSL